MEGNLGTWVAENPTYAALFLVLTGLLAWFIPTLGLFSTQNEQALSFAVDVPPQLQKDSSGSSSTPGHNERNWQKDEVWPPKSKSRLDANVQS